MILIFDTFAGLCNQFLDIQTAINFSNKINIILLLDIVHLDRKI